jgi:methylenetetrahydrofolate reductase (NADPH)
VSRFEAALNSKNFVVTSEILLGSQSGEEHILEHAGLLGGLVDAVLATDNQSGRLHASSLATAIVLQRAGVEPIMQLGCRNRNRIALLGDLLGAHMLGIHNVQVVRGERVPDGFKPRPKAELDVTATELIEIADRMRLGEGLAPFPDLLLGAVTSARSPSADWPARKLVGKVDAGARFVLTHTCMDIDILRAYFSHLVDMRLTHRARFIASVAVLSASDDAQWLSANKPNTIMPQGLIHRLEGASEPRAEGIAIAAELLRELAQVPGVSGAHIYAATDLSAIPEVLKQAGLAS